MISYTQCHTMWHITCLALRCIETFESNQFRFFLMRFIMQTFNQLNVKDTCTNTPIPFKTIFIRYRLTLKIRNYLLMTLKSLYNSTGHSFAGGAFLALCHDYRVMRSDRGWITWNEVLLGSRFPAPLHDFLQWVI